MQAQFLWALQVLKSVRDIIFYLFKNYILFCFVAKQR